MPHTALDETMASTSESSDSLRFRVSKLGGEEQDVQVERNCSLEEFKSLLAGRGLMKEGLAVDFIVEGVLLNLSRSGATIGDLNLAEDRKSMSLAAPPPVTSLCSNEHGRLSRSIPCRIPIWWLSLGDPMITVKSAKYSAW